MKYFIFVEAFFNSHIYKVKNKMHISIICTMKFHNVPEILLKLSCSRNSNHNINRHNSTPLLTF